MRSVVARWLAPILWLALCSVPSVGAFADDDKAAVMPPRGTQGEAFQRLLHKRLEAAHVALTPRAQTASATHKSGYKPTAVAKQLGAKVVVGGQITKSSGRLRAELEVRDAAGRVLKSVSVSSAKNLEQLALRASRRLLGSRLLPKQTRKPKQAAAPRPASPPLIVVARFTGAKGSTQVRVGAVRALSKKPLRFVSYRTFEKKARELKVDLTDAEGHIEPARALAVSALVRGEVEREDGLWTAYVRLIDGRSRKVLNQAFFDGTSRDELRAALQDGLWERFSDSIADLPVYTKESARSEQAEPKKKRRTRDDGVRPNAIDLGVYARLQRRNFGYKQDLRGDLREFKLGGAAAFALRLQWFPGTHATSGLGAQFGVDLDFERMKTVASKRDDGLSFPTKSQAWGVALAWRYPLARFTPGFLVGYGKHRFEVLPSGPARPGFDNRPHIPQVQYAFVRMRASLRANLVAGLSGSFEFGYLYVLSSGGISSQVWFPRAKAGGVEGALMLGYALPLGFEVRVGVDYRRYFFDLRPVPPNPPAVAGGALDRYWGTSFGIAWRM